MPVYTLKRHVWVTHENFANVMMKHIWYIFSCYTDLDPEFQDCRHPPNWNFLCVFPPSYINETDEVLRIYCIKTALYIILLSKVMTRIELYTWIIQDGRHTPWRKLGHIFSVKDICVWHIKGDLFHTVKSFLVYLQLVIVNLKDVWPVTISTQPWMNRHLKIKFKNVMVCIASSLKYILHICD